MSRWRRLTRTGNNLLACAVGGNTTHGETLWSEPRFLAIHPLYKKTAVVIHNSDLMYVRYGESMSFAPKFRRPSYSITEGGETRSVTREIVLVGSYTTTGGPLPYRENGLDINDLNSHGVSENPYPAARQTRYVFSASLIAHVVENRSGIGRPTTRDFYQKYNTSVTVIFDWDSGRLEIYKWQPTEHDIEIMGPYWDINVIDEESYPPIWVERGEDTTEYVYDPIDDEDFPVGVDYKKTA